jgi:hypothetical protein
MQDGSQHSVSASFLFMFQLIELIFNFSPSFLNGFRGTKLFHRLLIVQKSDHVLTSIYPIGGHVCLYRTLAGLYHELLIFREMVSECFEELLEIGLKVLYRHVLFVTVEDNAIAVHVTFLADQMRNGNLFK